ncbi:MAG: fibronectin type III domain-containing protein [Acidobacteriales bacterium]|nr:fibronectin type III domain-containing protein [Terriglobales bacterium]
MTTTSPFTVSATSTSPETIKRSYVYLDGVLVTSVSGGKVTATIGASPGSHRLSFVFTQLSGEQVRSTLYVNVTGTSQTSRAVILNWNSSTSTGVSGYRVYRGATAGGPYSRITSSTLPALTYEDRNVVSGRSYYYVVTAVASGGMESVYSSEAKAIVP